MVATHPQVLARHRNSSPLFVVLFFSASCPLWRELFLLHSLLATATFFQTAFVSLSEQPAKSLGKGGRWEGVGSSWPSAPSWERAALWKCLGGFCTVNIPEGGVGRGVLCSWVGICLMVQTIDKCLGTRAVALLRGWWKGVRGDWAGAIWRACFKEKV